MALEVLTQIRDAEARAEEIIAAAQREARELLKAVEAANLASERNAALEHRALAQKMLDDAAEQTRLQLEKRGAEEALKQAALCRESRTRLVQAATLVFERIVKHGDR